MIESPLSDRLSGFHKNRHTYRHLAAAGLPCAAMLLLLPVSSAAAVKKTAAAGPAAITLGLLPSTGTVVAGKPVTLTAHVTDSSSAKAIGTGIVSFYDTSTSTLLGTAEVSATKPKGAASIRVILGVGVHNLTAKLQATAAYAAVTSAPSTETVTGNRSYLTSSVLAGQSLGPAYVLADQLTFFGQVTPANVVTFRDTTGNKALGTGPLFGITQSYTPPSLLATGASKASLASAVGDFNGDGKVDFAATNLYDSSISVFISNGDGTFLPPVTYAAGTVPLTITTGDFNGDGNVDLVVADAAIGKVGVLLGVGDGTFSALTSFAAGPEPTAVTVGDFNADGVQDLAVVNVGADDNTPGTINILTGNGDGTFTTGPVSTVGIAPFNAVTADFNGDGNQDLVVVNGYSGNVGLLLGNGDGTFVAETIFATGTSTGTGNSGPIPYAAVVGDFDADGLPDVAVANLKDNDVTIFRNNSASTGPVFTTQNYPAGANPSSIAVVNVDGSATQSLVVANYGDGTVSVLSGNNTATFSAALQNFPSTGTSNATPYQVSVADFNGDGKQDLLINTFGGTNVGLQLGVQTAFAAFSGAGALPATTSAVYPAAAGDPYAKTTATLP
jgi:hypothetical protein